MNYAQIRKYDVANGPGIRTSIFVSGCTHNCKGCFNKKAQSFTYGHCWGRKKTDLIINFLQEKEIQGLSILGGEPFDNSLELAEVIKEIKKHTKKDIWIYSVYTFEEIIQDKNKKELLELCDILVDGKFIEELKDLTLKFKGSSNQRIIKIKDSLKEHKVVLW